MNEVDLRQAAPPEDWGVHIDRSAIESLAERWQLEPFGRPGWCFPGLPPHLRHREWFDYCGLAVSVLACLWPPAGEKVWGVDLHGERLEDAPALFACFTRAPDRASLRQGARGHSNLVELLGAAAPTLGAEFFAGSGDLQLVEERWQRVQALASQIDSEWSGTFQTVVEESGYHAPTLATLLSERLHGYGDEVSLEQVSVEQVSVKQGEVRGRIRFNKLANLATAIMAARSDTEFSGLELLPVYPDYMLPRILRHHRVLVYSHALATAVDDCQLIPAESEWEIAIRWATVYACEELRLALCARGNQVTTPNLDFHLWHRATLSPHASRLGEHHRTVTLRY